MSEFCAIAEFFCIWYLYTENCMKLCYYNSFISIVLKLPTLRLGFLKELHFYNFLYEKK